MKVTPWASDPEKDQWPEFDIQSLIVPPATEPSEAATWQITDLAPGESRILSFEAEVVNFPDHVLEDNMFVNRVATDPACGDNSSATFETIINEVKKDKPVLNVRYLNTFKKLKLSTKFSKN